MGGPNFFSFYLKRSHIDWPIINYFGTLGNPYGLNLRCYWEHLREHLRNLRTIGNYIYIYIYIFLSAPIKWKKLDRSQVQAEPSHWLHEISLFQNCSSAHWQKWNGLLSVWTPLCLLLRVWRHPMNFCCACREMLPPRPNKNECGLWMLKKCGRNNGMLLYQEFHYNLIFTWPKRTRFSTLMWWLLTWCERWCFWMSLVDQQMYLQNLTSLLKSASIEGFMRGTILFHWPWRCIIHSGVIWIVSSKSVPVFSTIDNWKVIILVFLHLIFQATC